MFSGCSCCMSPLPFQLPASRGIAIKCGPSGECKLFSSFHSAAHGLDWELPVSVSPSQTMPVSNPTPNFSLAELFKCFIPSLLPAFICTLNCLRRRSHSQNLGDELRCLFSFSTPSAIIFIQWFKYSPQTNGRLCCRLSGLQHVFYSNHMWRKSVYCEPNVHFKDDS